jgi:NAD(P)-dependent dehydrogenase (short-subunit alcohol dehydrogenase family)
VFVTSGVATRPHAYWGAYATSKAALDMMVKSWAAELLETKLRVNLLSPGAVRTAMRAQAFPGEDPDTLATATTIAETFLPLVLPSCTRHGEVVEAQKR